MFSARQFRSLFLSSVSVQTILSKLFMTDKIAELASLQTKFMQNVLKVSW